MKLILIFFCFAVLPAEQRYLFDFLASELSLGGLRAAASRRQPANKRDEPAPQLPFIFSINFLFLAVEQRKESWGLWGGAHLRSRQSIPE